MKEKRSGNTFLPVTRYDKKLKRNFTSQGKDRAMPGKTFFDRKYPPPDPTPPGYVWRKCGVTGELVLFPQAEVHQHYKSMMDKHDAMPKAERERQQQIVQPWHKEFEKGKL